jgi:hypothetical protein
MPTDAELRPLATAMLKHSDYAGSALERKADVLIVGDRVLKNRYGTTDEPKNALIDAFRRMRLERNAAYVERDTAHRRADSAQDRIRELESEVIRLSSENSTVRGYNIKLGIGSALVFVLYFVR